MFNEIRKQKYKLRNVLRTLDQRKIRDINISDHFNLVQVDLFLSIAEDNNVRLSQDDQQYLRNKIAQNGKLNYEEVIKNLSLIAVPLLNKGSVPLSEQETDLVWVLRSNQNYSSNELTRNLLLRNTISPSNQKLIKKKFKSSSSSIIRSEHEDFYDQKLQTEQTEGRTDKQMLPKISSSSHQKHSSDQVLNTGNTFHSNQSKKKREILTSYIQGYSPELQDILSKILLIRKDKIQQNNDNLKNLSAGSKKINILRNKQNKIYIKSVIPSEKIQQQKVKIRQYMKENEVDITHLNAIVGAFLDADEGRRGLITKKQLFFQISEQCHQFPPEFLFSLVQDMQVNSDDESEEAILSYANLRNIIEIYSNLPLFLKGDSNNSDSFKASMDYNATVTNKQDRVTKLFRYINNRVIEKFKDYRMGFRSMDKDFGGTIDFKEFIQGLEGIGIKFLLNDFRLVFETIDFDNKGVIDFFKFCLINIDKKEELENLRNQFQQKGKETHTSSTSKPPLPPLSVQGRDAIKKNLVFDEGKMPKNRNVTDFTKDVQKETPTKEFMSSQKSKLRRGLKSYIDLDSKHSFGIKNSATHDMIAILTNSYQENQNDSKIEAIKKTLKKKTLPPPKITHAQLVREKMNKLRYTPLNKSSSQIEERRSIKGTYSIPDKRTKNRSSSYLSIQGSRKI